MFPQAPDFLTKPVDEKTLLAAVEAAVDRSQQWTAGTRRERAIRDQLSSLSQRKFETMKGQGYRS